jgi:hypothetical protein
MLCSTSCHGSILCTRIRKLKEEESFRGSHCVKEEEEEEGEDKDTTVR